MAMNNDVRIVSVTGTNRYERIRNTDTAESIDPGSSQTFDLKAYSEMMKSPDLHLIEFVPIYMYMRVHPYRWHGDKRGDGHLVPRFKLVRYIISTEVKISLSKLSKANFAIELLERYSSDLRLTDCQGMRRNREYVPRSYTKVWRLVYHVNYLLFEP
jgi:hypothetical protein